MLRFEAYAKTDTLVVLFEDDEDSPSVADLETWILFQSAA